MTQIQLGLSTHERSLQTKTEIVNLYPEKADTSPSGLVLLTRPSLDPFATLPGSSVRGVYQQEGTFGGDLLAVSGTTLSRVTAAGVVTGLGTIAGAGLVSIAAGRVEALIANGATLRKTDGLIVSDKAFPDGQAITSVGYLNGYALAVPVNSRRLYYTDLLTGEFEGTRFIAAERSPDNLDGIVVTADEIWAFGAQSVEVFVPTGIDLADRPPFERVQGRLYERGCANIRTAAKTDNSVLWVGDDFVVYRGDATPVRVSDSGVEELIRKADPTALSAWTFGRDGHTFYVLNLGTQTLIYDLSTAKWLNWTSFGRPAWRGLVGCRFGARVLVGDAYEGRLWTLGDAISDDGDPIVQVFTGFVPMPDARAPHHNLTLDCAVGQAIATGQGSDPVITLEVSDDQGETFWGAGAVSLGRQGDYTQRVRWSRLGLVRPPGRVLRWTVGDLVRGRFSNARVNDAF